MYRATAKLEDGRILTESGNIKECIDWCEDVIREYPGKIEIDIKKVEE